MYNVRNAIEKLLLLFENYFNESKKVQSDNVYLYSSRNKQIKQKILVKAESLV